MWQKEKNLMLRRPRTRPSRSTQGGGPAHRHAGLPKSSVEEGLESGFTARRGGGHIDGQRAWIERDAKIRLGLGAGVIAAPDIARD